MRHTKLTSLVLIFCVLHGQTLLCMGGTAVVVQYASSGRVAPLVKDTSQDSVGESTKDAEKSDCGLISSALFALQKVTKPSDLERVENLPTNCRQQIKESAVKHDELRKAIAACCQEATRQEAREVEQGRHNLLYCQFKFRETEERLFDELGQEWFNPEYTYEDGQTPFSLLAFLEAVLIHSDPSWRVNFLRILLDRHHVSQEMVHDTVYRYSGNCDQLSTFLFDFLNNSKRKKELCVALIEKERLGREWLDYLRKKFDKERLNELLANVVMKKPKNLAAKFTTCKLLAMAGADINSFEVDNKHPLVVLTELVVGTGPQFEKSVVDAYVRVHSLHVSKVWRKRMRKAGISLPILPNSALVLICTLLLEAHQDFVARGPFWCSLWTMENVVRESNLLREHSVVRIWKAKLILRKMKSLIIPTKCMADGLVELSNKDRAEIYKLAKDLSTDNKNYLQWLYEEFMKRKESDNLFFGLSQEEELSKRKRFERKFLMLGVKPIEH